MFAMRKRSKEKSGSKSLGSGKTIAFLCFFRTGLAETMREEFEKRIAQK